MKDGNIFFILTTYSTHVVKRPIQMMMKKTAADILWAKRSNLLFLLYHPTDKGSRPTYHGLCYTRTRHVLVGTSSGTVQRPPLEPTPCQGATSSFRCNR